MYRLNEKFGSLAEIIDAILLDISSLPEGFKRKKNSYNECNGTKLVWLKKNGNNRGNSKFS